MKDSHVALKYEFDNGDLRPFGGEEDQDHGSPAHEDDILNDIPLEIIAEEDGGDDSSDCDDLSLLIESLHPSLHAEDQQLEQIQQDEDLHFIDLVDFEEVQAQPGRCPFSHFYQYFKTKMQIGGGGAMPVLAEVPLENKKASRSSVFSRWDNLSNPKKQKKTIDPAPLPVIALSPQLLFF